MTEPLYLVPRTGEIVLSSGEKRVLVKGVRTLPDEVAGDPAAIRYGIKPAHEMTADERDEHGLPPSGPDVDESLRVDPPAPPASKPAPPIPAAPVAIKPAAVAAALVRPAASAPSAPVKPGA